MPIVDPQAYSQRNVVQLLSSLRTAFQSGEMGRLLDFGSVAQKSPSNVGTASLFNITGGRVCITHIEGRVTTQLQAASRTLKLQYSPASATGDTDLSAASADVSGLTVGKKLVPTGTFATALNVALNEVALLQATRWVLEPGVIKVVSSSTDITGVIQWSVSWKPWDSAGVLTAA